MDYATKPRPDGDKADIFTLVRLDGVQEIAVPTPRSIEIQAAADIGVPSRILDLFTAIDWLPQSFLCHRAAAGLQLELEIGDLPEMQRRIIVAKVARISGVRSIFEHAPAG